MHYTALRRLPDELALYAFELLRGLFHQLPLRGRRNRHSQLCFQPLHAMEWHPRPILQQRDHRHCCGLELFLARRLRRTGGEYLAAGVAGRSFHLKHSRLQRCLPDDADQCRRFLLAIHFSFSASGTGIAGVKRGMRDGHLIRARKSVRTIAAMARTQRFLRFQRRVNSCGPCFRLQQGIGLFRVTPAH